MLRLKNIDLTLGQGTKLERPILKNLNLEVALHEFVVVIGGNGAGKSTLFNLISGCLKPEKGQVILSHQDVTKIPARLRAKDVSQVMQDPRLGTIENMTLMENMAMAYNRGNKRLLIPFSTKRRKDLFQEKLSMLKMGLEGRLDDLVAHLSGGQRQALSLIMATLSKSKIVLLDEITAALDPKIAHTIMALTETIIRKEKLTCLMITHNMPDALAYGDRTLVLKDCKFTKEFKAADKKHLTATHLAAEFGEF
ncbi:MAG: ATP-binding protein [Alphaproteobacteria bacterium 16-39-46]|nr:MAG: ATP-binding protein [Alphaproteobacteria bacterium 16-39-46]OZA42284.1 MAG: ATP-binding protein [Alphaproteobacteria bacterium 17-39-52]HQS84047.1 ATP-binding cassette domain-containing protein [Alphaproteobacteria bacterium]HQS93909.1 ATP-binding cassette domain-containing protein [Alphaproteobacteria bacterium]